MKHKNPDSNGGIIQLLVSTPVSEEKMRASSHDPKPVFKANTNCIDSFFEVGCFDTWLCCMNQRIHNPVS